MISSVAFHPSGTIVASASIDKSIKLFDIRTHKLIQHYGNAHSATPAGTAGGSGGVNSISFGGERGEWMISTGNDGLVKIWDLKEGHLLYTLYGHKYGSTTTAVFSPKGDFFASGGADSQVMVWKSNLESLSKIDNAVAAPAAQMQTAPSAASRDFQQTVFTGATVKPPPKQPAVQDPSIHSAFGGVTWKKVDEPEGSFNMAGPASSKRSSPVSKASSPRQPVKHDDHQKKVETIIAGQEYGNVSLTRPESPEIVNVGAKLFQEVFSGPFSTSLFLSTHLSISLLKSMPAHIRRPRWS